MIFPSIVPGVAAARVVPADVLLVASRRGTAVHAAPATVRRPLTAGGALRAGQGPMCGRRARRWRTPAASRLEGMWLCWTCARLLGLDPAEVETTAAELALVHAAAIRRADRLTDPEQRREARLNVRSAAIADGSLVAHVDAQGGIRTRPGLFPADAVPPGPEEAYGLPARDRWRSQDDLVSSIDRVRGKYSVERPAGVMPREATGP